MVNKYRPGVGQPFPFPKSGSDWTLEELNYIGIDHKLGCALDEIIPPRIVLSPKITEYLESRLNKPWQDLLASEISEVKEDRERFYARLLQVAGPKVKGVSYDIPYTSSQLSASTPPSDIEGFRTPEGGQTLIQPPRPSPMHFRPSGYRPSSPTSPTPAKKTGELKEASARNSRDSSYEWRSSPPPMVDNHSDRQQGSPTPKRNTGELQEATPQSSSDPSYQSHSSSPGMVESDSSHKEEKDPAEKDVEALARSLLLLIENAVVMALPSIHTETWYVSDETLVDRAYRDQRSTYAPLSNRR